MAGPFISCSQQRCLAVKAGEGEPFNPNKRRGGGGGGGEFQPFKTFFQQKAGMCIPGQDLSHKFYP